MWAAARELSFAGERSNCSVIIFAAFCCGGSGRVMLAIATIVLAQVLVAGTRIFPNGLPFLLLVVVWIVAYFVIRMREQRELQREIDALNDIERENNR